MKKNLSILILVILIACPCAVIAEPISNVFENVNVVDVESGQVISDVYLVLEDGKIAFLGPRLPRKYRSLNKVNMVGQYAMPGLIDTHVHFALGEVVFKKNRGKLSLTANNNDEISQWNANKLLRYGVTYVRNPGGSSEHNLRYRTNVANGKWHGPHAQVAGEVIDVVDFEGLGKKIDKRHSLEQEIRRQKELGVDAIKLYTGLSESQIQNAISIAKKYDLKTIAHLEKVSWTDAANWKIDNVVHAFPGSEKLLSRDAREYFMKNSRQGTFAFFEWFENVDLDSKPMLELYQALRKNKVHVDPTLIVFKNAFFANKKEVTEHSKLSDVHPELLNNWRTFFNFNIGWNDEDYRRAQRVWPTVLAFVRRLYKEKVILTIGTDVGNPWVIPGWSVHQEMALFSDAGIPNSDVLRMATIGAARQLGVDARHGSIEVGKVANIVFTQKNPFEDIRHTQKITAVYHNGISVDL